MLPADTGPKAAATPERRRAWFNISSQHVALAPLLLAILLLAAGVGAFVHYAGAIVASEGEEHQISLTLLNLQEIMALAQDAESGQRNFLLTGDGDYLQSFPDDDRGLERHLAQLRNRLSASPDALLQLDVVDTFRKRAFADFAQGIALRQQGQTAAAVAIVASGNGKYYMQKIRAGLDEVMKNVRAEQAKINARVASHVELARYSLFALVFIVIVVLAAAYAIVRVTFRRNQRLSERLKEEATHDTLTNLPNRRFFMSWIRYALTQATRDGTRVAMYFIDLDGFKQINDRWGHETGDAVLKSAARCFLGSLRQSDFLARLGGDEFVAVVPGAGDQRGLALLAERLGGSLAGGIDVAVGDLVIGCSIGIAAFPDDADSAERLLQKADEAMYRAKKDGKGSYAFYAASMNEPATIPPATREAGTGS